MRHNENCLQSATAKVLQAAFRQNIFQVYFYPWKSPVYYCIWFWI